LKDYIRKVININTFHHKHCILRITLKSQSLADALWTRIKDHVKDIVIDGDPHQLHVHGPPMIMKGTWKPIGLNNVSTAGCIKTI